MAVSRSRLKASNLSYIKQLIFVLEKLLLPLNSKGELINFMKKRKLESCSLCMHCSLEYVLIFFFP